MEVLNAAGSVATETRGKSNGSSAIVHSGAPSGKSIVLRPVLAIAHEPRSAVWLLKGQVERMAMILLYGAEGTYKSFLALHWAMQIAISGECVIYLSAEGRGLWKRLRAWCTHHYPEQPWADLLNGLPLFALERPINLSSIEVVTALIAAIDELGRAPALIVVDTITRNSDGSIERSNEDATAFLNLLDQQVRARYRCSILFLHHIGHAIKDRARGPYALTASTDANFRIDRPDVTKPLVTISSGRMKDCEPPAPLEMEAHVVTLDALDDDGKPETSVVLRPTGYVPANRPVVSGKNQKKLLAELERLIGESGRVGIWTEGELREIARGLGIQKQSARDAVHGLRALGYFVPCVGGSRLAYDPSGQKGQNRAEIQKSAQDVGAERADTPIGVCLSDRPDSEGE